MLVFSCDSKTDESKKWEKLPYQKKSDNIIEILDSLNSTTKLWKYGITKEFPTDSTMFLFRTNKSDNRGYVDSVTIHYKVNYKYSPVSIDTISLDKYQECKETFISQDMSCLLCCYLDYSNGPKTTLEIFNLINGKSVFKKSFEYFIDLNGNPFDFLNTKIVFSATEFNKDKYSVYIYDIYDNSLNKIGDGKRPTYLYPYNKVSYLSKNENQIYQYDLDSEESLKIYDGYNSLFRNSFIIDYKWMSNDSIFYIMERRNIRGINKFFWKNDEFFFKRKANSK